MLIPSTSFVDFASVPADLMSAFQLIPYQSAEDAVFKAFRGRIRVWDKKLPCDFLDISPIRNPHSVLRSAKFLHSYNIINIEKYINVLY